MDTATPTLNISKVDLSMNNYQCREIVSNAANVYSEPITSSEVVLTVGIVTVIAN